jgi:hypothetical protein
MSRILGQVYAYTTRNTDDLTLRARTHAAGADGARWARDTTAPAICRIGCLVHAVTVAGTETRGTESDAAARCYRSAEGQEEDTGEPGEPHPSACLGGSLDGHRALWIER